MSGLPRDGTDMSHQARVLRYGDVSTANLFGLPTFCQYVVVLLPAASFGAWRELAANTMTTNGA